MTKQEETLKTQKDLVSKQLEDLLKREQELRLELEQTIANINATKGALQYHDYIAQKLNEVELPITESIAEEKIKN